MSSTNKTANIRLNSWIASDKPQRADFNYDNEAIDAALAEHFADGTAHVTDEERALWNKTTHVGTYYGNGNSSRTITTNCPFTPSFVIVFANSMPPSVTNTGTGNTNHYTGFASSALGSYGLSLENGGVIRVTNTVTPTYYKEYASLNESGVSYCYVLFK